MNKKSELLKLILEHHQDGHLDYWSNEEPEAFIIRNRKVFDRIGLSWVENIEVANQALEQLPDKTRDRNIASTGKQKPLPPINRKTDPDYGFTIILDETGIGTDLILQPLAGGESFILRITSMEAHRIKEAFTPEYVKSARQTQVKASDPPEPNPA